MNRLSLLRSWPLARGSVAARTSSTSNQSNDDQIIRAVAETIAHPLEVDEVIEALIEDGEFDAAELALIDDDMLASLTAQRCDAFEARLQEAKRAHMASVTTQLSELRLRASRCPVQIDEGWVIAAGKRRVLDGQALGDLESTIRDHEQARTQQLRARLEDIAPMSAGQPDRARWRAMVEQAIARGAFDIAGAALERGPQGDASAPFDVPQPPVWGHRREPLDRVVGWFFEQGAMPPGFESYLPTRADEPAWKFLRALRDHAPAQELLAAVASVLGCRLARLEARHAGVVGFLAGLSAEGFHAFGETRMPAGIPLWLPDDPQAPEPEVVEDDCFVRLVVARNARRSGPALHLMVDDLLAVLHDDRRRERILVQLGRQLPLRLAFGDRVVDRSIRWPRSDLPDLLVASRPPTVLLGAPGMGKTTHLVELATQADVVVHDASTDDELSHTSVVLIDGVATSGPAVRALVKNVHWVRTMTQPAPVVVIAARPEARSLFEQHGANMFEIVELPARSVASLREQAAAMLAWVGIGAEEPGSYDRMALLACGNPTVLYHLCGALANRLAPTSGRTFSSQDLEHAWESTELRSAVRGLLWEPLEAQDGLVDILRVLVELSDPGAHVSRTDLAWFVEQLTAREVPDLPRILTILRLYGLIDEVDTGVCLAVGGAELLVRHWLGDAT
jgi:hypothetical protein